MWPLMDWYRGKLKFFVESWKNQGWKITGELRGKPSNITEENDFRENSLINDDI